MQTIKKEALHCILNEHYNWRLDSSRYSRALLRDVDLRGLSLRKYDLERVQFERVNLEGVDLSNANLEGAYLRAVNLRNAYLRDSILDDVFFEGVSLQNANMQGSKFKFARFVNTNLDGSDLRWADLRGTTLPNDLIVYQNGNIVAYIQPSSTRIDCHNHSNGYWRDISDEELSMISPFAVLWWKQNKARVCMLMGSLKKGGLNNEKTNSR